MKDTEDPAPRASARAQDGREKAQGMVEGVRPDRPLSFTRAEYVGGHPDPGRPRKDNLFLTPERLGIGITKPSAATIPLDNIASVLIEGDQVAKSRAGAVSAFGPLGLAAKNAKERTTLTVTTTDGEKAYYTIDKQPAVTVRARMTPALMSAGIPFGDEPQALEGGTPPGDLAERLRSLAALRDEGLLTDEEAAAFDELFA